MPPAAASRPSVEVMIDALVLHGLRLSPAQAERVRAALAAELAARLAGEDAAVVLARAAGGVPQVCIGAGDSPEAIARALAGGMTRPAKEGGR
jgi:hypothetical protein